MPELILVTGASGFLGSHILVQLLENGYSVRALLRGPKVAELRDRYASYGDRFEAVEISDIATDNFSDALKGVDAIIHSGTPVPNTTFTEAQLNNTIDGVLNVVKQAEKAGIKRVVVTSSISTVVHPTTRFTDQDWLPTTREAAMNGSPMSRYSAAKTLAERELWAFADAHPDLDITALNPPFFYGPFVEGFNLPRPNYALSTNMFLYSLLSPSGQYPPSPGHIDVRDAAKAHVLALSSPPTATVGRKRIIIASPREFGFKATVDLIAEKRPELKERLIKAPAPAQPFKRVPVNFGRVEEVLGFRQDEFRTIEETILGTIDSLLSFEKEWVKQGLEVSVPVFSG
ncbi:hypothetical protein Hypma_001850 [Hypsizygus marmoreus]|uniref:NAD-dependent epimerase/dehydratase domain-containing protein n=1 Tax=Hypsizygus marmoreus TaxID=39966 RepID=A0A369JD79_HYPMA|nr:hypothetical protein Hypma_001850 [Hypsizygus marmoreus]